jgi:hypothetical protein
MLFEMNRKEQGAIGVAKAVAYYGEHGYAVFVPVSDIRRYDLLIDDGRRIQRVEVKTTNRPNGEVNLRTLGGNQSWSGVVKRLSSDDCDLVFLVNLITGTCKEFLIKDLEGRATVNVR